MAHPPITSLARADPPRFPRCADDAAHGLSLRIRPGDRLGGEPPSSFEHNGNGREKLCSVVGSRPYPCSCNRKVCGVKCGIRNVGRVDCASLPRRTIVARVGLGRPLASRRQIVSFIYKFQESRARAVTAWRSNRAASFFFLRTYSTELLFMYASPVSFALSAAKGSSCRGRALAFSCTNQHW